MRGVSILTVGHGRLAADDFVALLRDASVECVVDVRSFPGSRANPQFGRHEMERWMPQSGLGYAWICNLGGRRRLRAVSRHEGLRNEAFRAYADHMETEAFRSGVGELLACAVGAKSVVMCSESLWWRCHRRLIADHLVLVRRVAVIHVMHDGRLIPHVPTMGAQIVNGGLVYTLSGLLSGADA